MDSFISPNRNSDLEVHSRVSNESISTEGRDQDVLTPRVRSRTISQLATPFKSPILDKTSSNATKLTNFTSDSSNKPDKARLETRKLLSHILNELSNRPRPPPVWDSFGSNFKNQKSHSHLFSSFNGKEGPFPFRANGLISSDSDSEDERQTSFSPDITFELLNRLRDVLSVAKLKLWSNIFNEGSVYDDANSETTERPAFRFRRNGFQSRSRSNSPGRSNSKKSGTNLLIQCIATLGSIILEDCRFQMRSIRLTQPPNALQALTLDIAQLLIYMHRSNSKILYEIGTTMIPAFSTFPQNMHRRLLAFFEDSLLRLMLQNLRDTQGSLFTPSRESPYGEESEAKQESPVVAIQVDEAEDDDLDVNNYITQARGWKQWVPPKSGFQGLFSTYAPAQSLEIYYLAAVIGPLLAAILDGINFKSQDIALSHRLEAFFTFLADYKADTPLNLLEIVAYHSSRSRLWAISLLQTFWPMSFGHISVGKPFPLLTHSETLRALYNKEKYRRMSHAHFHQFLPWFFSPEPSSIVFEGSAMHDCHLCTKQIIEFGLLCPFCMCAVHSNCYDAPEGSYLSHYPTANDEGKQRVAVHRFSYVRTSNPGAEPESLSHKQHTFGLVNLFTLTLCSVCRLPLWGNLAQGLRCHSCNQFVHASCLREDLVGDLPGCHIEPDSDWITISWKDLRKSFLSFYKEIIFKEGILKKCTFEELSVYWSILWTQLQILKFGIASGSIIVARDRQSSVDVQGGVNNFELHTLEKLYHDRLFSPTERLPMAPMLENLLKQAGHNTRSIPLMYDWPVLTYLTSVIKSPPDQEEDMTNEFLNVVSVLREDELPIDLSQYPLTVASVAHLRDALGKNFSLFQTPAACLLISHLRHIGFFESTNLPHGYFCNLGDPGDKLCVFGLPLGLDLSSDVETLIAAIESCLEDLDISLNESGFLLLVRNLWPSDMLSDYALTRLTRAVLTWILLEDDNLVVILREYVAKNRNLPGVPTASESRCWPNSTLPRQASSGSINNGNDYVACRKVLLMKYAARWLFALHSQDAVRYGNLIYNTISDMAEEQDRTYSEQQGDQKELAYIRADKVLKYIMKICQHSIVFSVVDDLFIKWLTEFPGTRPTANYLATLPRLFNREAEGSARWTTVDLTVLSYETNGSPLLFDPWRVVTDIASQNYEGLKRILNWLCVFASSGVDIPVSTFLKISLLALEMNASFEDQSKLADAAFMSIWIRSLGRQGLYQLISDLHDRNVAFIIEKLSDPNEKGSIHRFVRLTLSSFLLLLGCDRTLLERSGLITSNDTEGLVSRRKVAKRASQLLDYPIEDMDIFDFLVQYVEEGTDEMRCMIAKFLSCLISDGSLINTQELESIILKNSYSLSRCIWRLYDMQAPEISDIRATLLLRLLIVDTRSFDDILSQYLDGDGQWENSLSAVTILFQIILDVTKPSFNLEGGQWRSSVTEIFIRFFSCLWTSEKEEVRLATECWAQSLQPTHFQAITSCFDEYLTRVPISERIKLVSFLLQLRSHFPSWKVLSWGVIIDMLMDDDYAQRKGGDASAMSPHLSFYGISSRDSDDEVDFIDDPDVATLQSALLLLSMQMIADGITIDIFSYLKIKLQLAISFRLSDPRLVPSPSGHSFHVQFGDLVDLNPSSLSCVHGLMMLLDSSRSYELAPSAMSTAGADDDQACPVLVGSVILDIFLRLLGNMLDDCSKIPSAQTKLMLQTFIISLYKHDIESSPLRHLREPVRSSVMRVSNLLLEDIGYEQKQLVLAAMQAYRKRWLNYASFRDLLLHQLSNLIKFIASSKLANDDILASQAKSLIEDILTVHIGLFYHMGKKPLPDDSFTVLRSIISKNARETNTHISLPDAIFRETLHGVVLGQNDPNRKTVLENMKKFVEVVYHQGYSPDTLSYAGDSFIHILRNASELSDDEFNPDALFFTAATLIQYNKGHMREFLPHIETALRISLIRFVVSKKSLLRLLQVTSTLYRRAGSEINIVLMTIADVLSEGFRGKSRVVSSTMKAMAEALFPSEATYMYATEDVLSRLASDAFFYLQNSSATDVQFVTGFHAYRAASMLVLRAAKNDPDYLSRHLNEYAVERNGRHSWTVRAWNSLVLEALETSKPAICNAIMKYLPGFSMAYHISLRSYSQAMGIPVDLTVSDINQAFVAIKLWLLLARKCSTDNSFEEPEAVVVTTTDKNINTSEYRNSIMVWNELWASFERLATLCEVDNDVDEVTPLATLVWSSVADILLFLRLMRSPLALDSTSHANFLNRLKNLGKGDSLTHKITRTLNSISDPPPEIPTETLLAQINQELMAMEKYHALETRHDIGRTIPDRSRKDLRL